jgi:formate transporter
MAWASRRVPTWALLRNWLIVFAGNFVGAGGTAALVYLAGTHRGGDGAFGATALAIAHAKVQLGFTQAIVLGVLCNTLVCLAVWLTLSARSTVDRVLAIVPPISAFVASGFEHSVANMYFVPLGLLITSLDPDFAAAAGAPGPPLQALTWGAFLGRNLLPVTVGNVIGGAGLVGLVYWFVYLRPRGAEDRAAHRYEEETGSGRSPKMSRPPEDASPGPPPTEILTVEPRESRHVDPGTD